MSADRLASAEAFLARSADVLADDTAPAPLAACAWCSHPLDDGSPSGEFCGERCAAYWRAGCDWDPEERCACRTCDPEWWAERDRITIRRDTTVAGWLDAIRAAHAGTVSRGIFQTMPSHHWERERAGEPYRWGGREPEIHVDTSAAERVLGEVRDRVDSHAVNRWATDQFRRRWYLGVDVAQQGQVTVSAARYDDAGNLVVETDLSGWVDSGDVPTPFLRDLSNDLPPAPVRVGGRRGASVTHVWVDEAYSFDRRWMATWAWHTDAEPERSPRWAGRKPNRRRRKRRS